MRRTPAPASRAASGCCSPTRTTTSARRSCSSSPLRHTIQTPRAGRADIDGPQEIDAPSARDAHPDDPPPFIQSSGDFAFCSRALFERIGGFREDLPFTNTHKDSIFCVAAAELTGRTEKIGATFHLRHTKDGAGRRRLEYDWRRVASTPQPRFGLEGVCDEEAVAPGVTRLRLRAELRATAEARTVPRGRVPPAYRIPWRHRLKRHPLVQHAVRRLRRRPPAD